MFASPVLNVAAVQAVLEEVVNRGDATALHIYTRGFPVASGDIRDVLVISNNGSDSSSTSNARPTSSTAEPTFGWIGRTWHEGILTDSLLASAEDVYKFVSHSEGKQRQRSILRFGRAVKKAFELDGARFLCSTCLQVPSDFVYMPSDRLTALDQLFINSPVPLKKSVVEVAEVLLAGEHCPFKDLALLLELLKELGEGPGIMYIIAGSRSDSSKCLVPATVNGRPDLVFEEGNPANRCSVSLHQRIAQKFLLGPAFRELRQAAWEEQNPGRPFVDQSTEIFVQQQPVDMSANSLVAAAEASGLCSPVVPIQHPSEGTLGWLQLAYQDKDAGARYDLAHRGKSGLHIAYGPRILNRQPSFFSKSAAQRHFMVKVEESSKALLYNSMRDMVFLAPELCEGIPAEHHPKIPFTLDEVKAWSRSAGHGSGNNYRWLGGMGIVGVFVANKAHFSLNDDQLMEHMMAWAVHNPPPDMAARIAAHEPARLLREAQIAATNERRAAARRAKGLPVEGDAPQAADFIEGVRRAKMKALDKIKTVQADEEASDEEALEVCVNEDVLSAPATPTQQEADNNALAAPMELGAAAPVPPATPAKRPRVEASAEAAVEAAAAAPLALAAAPSAPDVPGQHEKRACHGGVVKLEPAGAADPDGDQASNAQITVRVCPGEKLEMVVTGTPNADQIKFLTTMIATHGKAPDA